MHLNEVYLLYQKILKYQNHVANYTEILAEDVTPYGLQLKKKAVISAISPDFNNRLKNVLKDLKKKF